MVGLDGLEPTTSVLSGPRSNHLSYRPFKRSYGRIISRCYVGIKDSGQSVCLGLRKVVVMVLIAISINDWKFTAVENGRYGSRL